MMAAASARSSNGWPLGIASCEVEYDGVEGLADIYPADGVCPDGEGVNVPADVECLLKDFVGRTLPDGWADELGSRGTVTFEVASGVIVFDHWVREVEEFFAGWRLDGHRDRRLRWSAARIAGRTSSTASKGGRQRRTPRPLHSRSLQALGRSPEGRCSARGDIGGGRQAKAGRNCEATDVSDA
jgi:hypothetical protein